MADNDPDAGAPRDAEEAIAAARQAYELALNLALRSDAPWAAGADVAGLATDYIRCVASCLGGGAVLTDVQRRIAADASALQDRLKNKLKEHEDASRLLQERFSIEAIKAASTRVRLLAVERLLSGTERCFLAGDPEAFRWAERVFSRFAHQRDPRGKRARELAELAAACAAEPRKAGPHVKVLSAGLREIFDELRDIQHELAQVLAGSEADPVPLRPPPS